MNDSFCCECKNFLGGGDFNTCCKVKPDLVHANSNACYNFVSSGDRLFVKFSNGCGCQYRFGEEWESGRLLVEGGYDSPSKAYIAKMKERGLIR